MTGSPPLRTSLGEAVRALWSREDAGSWPRFVVAEGASARIASGSVTGFTAPLTTPIGPALRAAAGLGPLVVGAARFAPLDPGEAPDAGFAPFGGACFFAPRDHLQVSLLPPPGLRVRPASLRPEAVARYRSALTTALGAIAGNVLTKVVLARSFLLTDVAGAPLDLRAAVPELLDALHAAAGATARVFLLAPTPDAIWLGATPERLARVEPGFAETEAVAGTCRLPGQEAGADAAVAALTRSDKDLREHAAVVDHLRAALGRLGADLSPPGAAPTVRRLPGLAHLVTPLTARLAEGTTPTEVVAALHPSPAVNGTPFEAARDLIAAAEGFDRGVYAGPIGFFEGGRASFDVGLRGALLTAGGVRVFAGAGVVAGSTVSGELAETAAKAVATARALGFDVALDEDAP